MKLASAVFAPAVAVAVGDWQAASASSIMATLRSFLCVMASISRFRPPVLGTGGGAPNGPDRRRSEGFEQPHCRAEVLLEAADDMDIVVELQHRLHRRRQEQGGVGAYTLFFGLVSVEDAVHLLQAAEEAFIADRRGECSAPSPVGPELDAVGRVLTEPPVAGDRAAIVAIEPGVELGVEGEALADALREAELDVSAPSIGAKVDGRAPVIAAAGQVKECRGVEVGLGRYIDVGPNECRESGVLEARTGQSIIVPHPTRAAFGELRDIRVEVEGLAAARGLACISAAAIADLAAMHDRLMQAKKARDCGAALRSNEAFHLGLARESGMRRLFRVVDGPENWSVSDEPNCHLEVLDALRRRDAVAARAAIAEDIVGGGAELMTRLPD